MADDATPTDETGTEQTADETAQSTGTDAPDATTGEDTTDWKAMARKHEQRAKENAAAAKELAALKKSQMTAQEAAETAAKEAGDRAEAAERRAALLQAAVDHGLAKDDLDLLDGIPADQIDARAKKLSARIKTATPAGSSGSEVGGGKQSATEMDPAKIAAQAANRKPQVRIY